MIIEITENVRVGKYILEKGDKIRIIKESAVPFVVDFDNGTTKQTTTFEFAKKMADDYTAFLKDHGQVGFAYVSKEDNDITLYSSAPQWIKDLNKEFVIKESLYHDQDVGRYHVSWWNERDRNSIIVTDNETDKTIWECWDEDCYSMVEDGWFKWGDSAGVIDYLTDVGVIK